MNDTIIGETKQIVNLPESPEQMLTIPALASATNIDLRRDVLECSGQVTLHQEGDAHQLFSARDSRDVEKEPLQVGLNAQEFHSSTVKRMQPLDSGAFMNEKLAKRNISEIIDDSNPSIYGMNRDLKPPAKTAKGGTLRTMSKGPSDSVGTSEH